MFPKNSGTPKSSILIGFSIVNHPFWGTTIFGNTQIDAAIWLSDSVNYVKLFLEGSGGDSK